MDHSLTLRRRLALALTALAVGVTGVVPLATDGALGAPEDQGPAALAAADWLDRELDSAEPDFDAFGVASARTDVLPALTATGSEPGAARQAFQELQANADGYASSPGAIAKVILAAASQHEGPSSVIEGRDLEAELRSSIGDEGMVGADVFTHSLAVLALATTPAGVPGDAADALASLQCSDGGFSFSGTCSDGADLDTTALALQALIAAGAEEAVDDAAAFLVDAQNGDGSFPNAFGEPNANTAGVAGQALRAAGETDAADMAAEFVMSLQIEDGPDAGGIRFTAADDGANGFATLQGILALGAGPLHELSSPPYADVSFDDIFGSEIDWLGDQDISQGCDPPDNDRYCPGEEVTRGQMAAFLVRALDLPPGDTTFTDTGDSVFAADIAALADAGITKGCNPPTNDQYCPDEHVTRGQMAALLFRALAG